MIDEISMFQAFMVDAILEAATNAGTEVTLTGDFCQLPPIPEKNPRTGRSLPWTFAFEGTKWPTDVVQLSGSYRQRDPQFLEVLNSLRGGQVRSDYFAFESDVDEDFDGVTILARNERVNGYNANAWRVFRARLAHFYRSAPVSPIQTGRTSHPSRSKLGRR